MGANNFLFVYGTLKRGEKNHRHGSGREIEIHRSRAEEKAEQDEDGRDEESDLRRAAEGDAHAQIEMIFARGREGGRHFR